MKYTLEEQMVLAEYHSTEWLEIHLAQLSSHNPQDLELQDLRQASASTLLPGN